MLKNTGAALAVLLSLTFTTPAYAGLYPLEEPNFSVEKTSQKILENAVVDSLSNYGWLISAKRAMHLPRNISKEISQQRFLWYVMMAA